MQRQRRGVFLLLIAPSHGDLTNNFHLNDLERLPPHYFNSDSQPGNILHFRALLVMSTDVFGFHNQKMSLASSE